MRLGIIGCGIVGGTLKRWLEKNTKHEIVVYDPPQGYDQPIGACDAAFIAVPVPTKGMKQDLSILREAITIAQLARYIYVRSSVLPGTCDQLAQEFKRSIHAMPEFLTERTRDRDMDEQPIMVGFSSGADVSGTTVLREIFDGKKSISIATAKECEIAKYAHNCFGALKVTYFNAIADLCKRERVDFESVRDLVLMSGYINDTHTQVPGPDGKYGFGGKCFPKDLAAFIGWVGSNPAHALLKDVLCLNRFYRGEKDYDDGSEIGHTEVI